MTVGGEATRPVLVIKDGRIWQVDGDEEIADVMDWLLEEHAVAVEGPVRGLLLRRQVVSRLGAAVPEALSPDFEFGDDRESVRAWFPEKVTRFIENPSDATADTTTGRAPDTATGGEAVADETSGAPAADEKEDAPWPYRSRRWNDVAKSGADQRMLIVTSRGVVTPSGFVAAGPLQELVDLQEVVAGYPWALPPKPQSGGRRVQVWITIEAMDQAGFAHQDVKQSKLADTVSAVFGVRVSYHQSGWFTGHFPLPDGTTREVEMVLMPYLGTEPSKQRPNDRGLAGIKGKPSELPDDEVDGAHILAERMAWLYQQGEVMAAPRWAEVAAQIAVPIMGRAKPKALHSSKPPARKASPLPDEIAEWVKRTPRWWEEWVNPEAAPEGVKLIGVEADQQAAYLPSAEDAVLGYGEPSWADPDPSVFALKQPPFQIVELLVPAGRDCDGLTRELPLPLPWMDWEEPILGWAVTVDVLQLLAPVAEGGAGLAIGELDILRAFAWPEQHRWLRGPAEHWRKVQGQARAEGRTDRVEMTKAQFTSFFGKMSSTSDDGAWKYPLQHLQQPAWYWTVESLTRHRGLGYAVQKGIDHSIYPYSVNRDAWVYRLPADVDPKILDDKGADDGTLRNGRYRVKNVWPVDKS